MRFDARSVRAWVIAGAFAAITAASIAPIRSNDYFWHLATGRWIWEHRALPATDPFGVASSRQPWINTEWLFDAGVYPLYRMGGHAAVSWTLALATSGLFCVMLVFVMRRAGEGAGAPLLLVVISWYFAAAWIRERPSAVGAACLAILLMLLMRPFRPWTIVAIFATSLVWANVHPSAILAPIVVALFIPRRVDSIAASAVALFINPFGVHGVLAPFRLVSVIREFHNEEWAPTTPGEFPFFYAIVIATVLLFAIRRRREDLPRALVFLLLTVLAIRFCRNQALFFVALPVLAGPSLPPLTVRTQRLIGVAAAAVMIAILSNAWFRTGIDPTKFPVDSVARLRSSHLPGPIYNTYGLGGFLIWSFYPERRVITDGRNELYIEFNREHDRALRDIREWHRFLDKYNLRVAVYDYDRPMVRLENGREVPPAAVYFPPREWALLAKDRVAMVLVRKDVRNAGVSPAGTPASGRHE